MESGILRSHRLSEGDSNRPQKEDFVFREMPYRTNLRRSRIRRKTRSPAARELIFRTAGILRGEKMHENGRLFEPVSGSRYEMAGPSGGESGIRTHGTVSRTHAFQACALSHSAIPPRARAAHHTAQDRACQHPEGARRRRPCTDADRALTAAGDAIP